MQQLEHETKIEMMGREYAVLVQYERDPEDGHPLIDVVEISRWYWRYEAGQGMVKDRVNLDITRMLEEDQISVLENEIKDALRESAESAKTERMIEEDERQPFYGWGAA